MQTQQNVKKQDKKLKSKSVVFFMISVLSLLQTAKALEWEPIQNEPYPGIIITDERPLCWFTPTDYWIEAPEQFHASNRRFDIINGVIEYYAQGSGGWNSYQVKTHVYDTIYNALSQVTDFKENRYYVDSGNAYHIEVSGVSYDPSGNVEDGYSVNISPTTPPPSNQPEKPINPAPSNGAMNQPITVELNWSDGGDLDSRATSYDIYLSRNRDFLESTLFDDNEFKVSQTGTTYNPDHLLYGTTYYWRVDSKNMEGIRTGDIWSFTTAGITSILYVDADAPGANDGSSWSDAYKHLQDALANANASVKPVEIRVAEGVYTPDQGIGISIGDKNSTFQLINGVTLKGGYAGFSEFNPDMRNRVIFETILRGDLLDNDGPNTSSYNDNSIYVVTGSTTDQTAVLDGFTIMAGTNGGLYNYSGSPTVTNCIISGNAGYGMFNETNSNPNLNNCTLSWNSATDQGGGMYNSTSNPILTNCTFRWNDGSGMYNSDSNPILTHCEFNQNNGSGMTNNDSSNPTLTSCTFSKNVVSDKGGGIFNSTDSSPTLIYCTFNENSASQGGGIYNEGGLEVINCTFSKNSVNNYGGAVYNSNCNPSFVTCSFTENSGRYGAGVYNEGSDPNLMDSTFDGNLASSYGGGMYNKDSNPLLDNCLFSENQGNVCGGMYNITDSSPILTNCRFSSNSSNGVGGGIYNYTNCNPILNNCTFISNSANTDGGGMYNSNNNPTLSNCTFNGNSAHDEGGGMYNGTNSSPTLTNCDFIENFSNGDGGGMYNISTSSPTLTGCLFSENTASSEGGGVYNDQNNRSIFMNCVFWKNSSASGGGFYCYRSSSSFSFDNSILSNCTFIANSANSNGGGIYNSNESNLILNDCTFAKNYSTRGGAIYNTGSCNPAIENCKFSGNWADYGGGVYNSANSEPDLINCIFSGNLAQRGGGVYNYYSNSLPAFMNCTFSGNTASQEGSVIYNRVDCTPTLTNCIIWHNTLTEPVISQGCIITYSNIQGGWPGDGNIDVEPLFANIGYWADNEDPNIVVEPSDPNTVWIDGDYHLKSQAGRWDPNSLNWIQDDVTSPCIDAGYPSMDWTAEIWPHGKCINMGAYGGTREASMSLSEEGHDKDLNNDDSITWDDVLQLAEKWTSCDVPLAEDLNRDGIVDTNDLLFYVGNWATDSINAIPMFDPIADQSVKVNQRLIFSVTADDADGDALVYLSPGLPDDALFYEQLFSWTPGPESVGTHMMTFVVSDYKSLDFITVQIVVGEEL